MDSIKSLVKKEFISLQKETPLSQFIAELKKNQLEVALVFDKKEFLGVTDKKQFFKSRVDFSKLQASHVIVSVPIVSEETSLNDAVRLLFDSDSRTLPVKDKKTGKIIGVLNAIDVIRELQEIMDNKVSEFAVTDLITLKPSDSVGDAMHLMREKNIDHLPVIDENERLIGIVTMKDILEKYFNRPLDRNRGFDRKGHSQSQDPEAFSILSKLPITNEMIENVVTIQPGNNIRQAVQKMSDKNISDLIVVENGKPTGIIAKKDLLKAFIMASKPLRNIQFIGLHEVKNLEDYNKIQEIAAKNYDELSKRIDNIAGLSIHIKVYNKEGRKQKYSVHAKIATPGQLFVSGKSRSRSYWNAKEAVEEALNHLKREIFSSFKDRYHARGKDYP